MQEDWKRGIDKLMGVIGGSVQELSTESKNSYTREPFVGCGLGVGVQTKGVDGLGLKSTGYLEQGSPS